MTAADQATAAAIARKLTTRQREVLRDAAGGRVYRMDLGVGTQYASYVDGWRGAVTVTVRALMDRGLLRLGDPAGWRRYWHLTELGAAVLARLDPPDGGA